MAIGTVRIIPDTQGTRGVIYLDGHRLTHVRDYLVKGEVNQLPTVTITFSALAEITEPRPYIPLTAKSEAPSAQLKAENLDHTYLGHTVRVPFRHGAFIDGKLEHIDYTFGGSVILTVDRATVSIKPQQKILVW